MSIEYRINAPVTVDQFIDLLAQATLAAIAVTPGEVLTFTAWLRCNAGRLVRLAFKDNANSDYWTGLPREADGNWQHEHKEYYGLTY